VAGVYYALTSLSTVGFGDFHPKTDIERIMCAIVLLFGVAIFSYIMGEFIAILAQVQEIAADLDEDDNLSKFFSLLKKFNNGKPIRVKLKD